MTDTQDKVLNALRALAPRGIDALRDYEYANTGVLRFQREGEFTDLVKIRYDFQAGHVTLVWGGESQWTCNQNDLYSGTTGTPEFASKFGRLAARIRTTLDGAHE